MRYIYKIKLSNEEIVSREYAQFTAASCQMKRMKKITDVNNNFMSIATISIVS